MLRRSFTYLLVLSLVIFSVAGAAYADVGGKHTAADYVTEAIKLLSADPPDVVEAESSLELAVGAKEKKGVKIKFVKDALELLREGNEKKALNLLKQSL